MDNKLVIISGCTGQSGSFMVEYLLKNTDYNIVGGIRRTSQAITSNLAKAFESPRFKLAQLDLVDVHSISELIKKEKPDYFLNFAASTFVADSWNNPALCMQVNAVALIHILEAVRNYAPNCRVYSAGSSEQYSDVISELEEYQHPFNPKSIYGVSKATADLISKVYKESYGLYVVHGILYNHESIRRQKYFVSRKITEGVARIYHAIKKEEKFSPIELGNINARRDWSDARDFCDGVWRMMNQEVHNSFLKEVVHKACFIDESQTKFISKYIKNYTLASGETHEIREFIEKAFKVAGIEGFWDGEGLAEQYVISNYQKDLVRLKNNILIKINANFYRPNEVLNLMGNSSLVRKELGWEPKISFDKLVEEMVLFDIEDGK